jgi:hypothetical protein
MLLSLSGMASIVDGFAVWAGFLRDFVDLYRAWIREPVLGIVHLIWPASWPPIPGWVVDWFCISGSFFFAGNIVKSSSEGRGLLGDQLDSPRGFLPRAAFSIMLGLLIGPLYVLPIAIGALTDWTGALRVYLYWLTLLCVFALLMFLNWQLKRAGVW